MARLIKEQELLLSKKPDSLTFIGHQKIDKFLMRVIDYTQHSYQEIDRIHVRDLPDIPDSNGEQNIRWISVYGLHDTKSIEELGQLFSIDRLTIKSILNTGQRPKCDEFNKYLYLLIKLIHFSPLENKTETDQLGILLGENLIITLHERPIDFFGPLRKQLKDGDSKLRKSGIEYLSYCILESVVDSYIQTAGLLGTKIEEFERRLLNGKSSSVLNQIVTYKRITHYLIRNISPVCEFIGDIDPYERSLLQPYMDPLYKDLQNQFVLVRETLETYNDTLTDYIGLCHAGINNKIFNVLATIISIFILAVLIGCYILAYSNLSEQVAISNYFMLGGLSIVALLVIGLSFKNIKNGFRKLTTR